jgi:hypothetical protein
MEDLIKKMIEVKAHKVAAFNKSREEDAKSNNSNASPTPKIQQKDSTFEFNAFSEQF